jgi:DMSO/TMAO reductase YedYZ heme-binding membrane subunit
MIRLSVQLASPWIYLAFVATALGQLFPSSFSSWLLRNRRYVGLSFAAGFGWQAVFIAVLLGLHGDYYATTLHDTAEFITRMLSYTLLLALTVTSFFPVRRAMDPKHWRLLHRVGIWYFWAAIWVSYAETVMAGDTRAIAIVFVISGLLALTLRCGAFLKKRSALVVEHPAETTTP